MCWDTLKNGTLAQDARRRDAARPSLANRALRSGRRRRGRGLSIQDSSRGDQERLLHVLLRIFEQQIMPTFRSRYTQYILFYVVCLRPDFPDAFLAMLVRPGVSRKPLPWCH